MHFTAAAPIHWYLHYQITWHAKPVLKSDTLKSLSQSLSKYLVPVNRHITFSPGPLLQICGPDRVICGHVKRSVHFIDDIVGAVQDEECHEDEEGRQDHHPVAMLSLQREQERRFTHALKQLSSTTLFVNSSQIFCMQNLWGAYKKIWCICRLNYQTTWKIKSWNQQLQLF